MVHHALISFMLLEATTPPIPSFTDLIMAMMHQMVSSPSGIIVIVGVSVIAYFMEIWPQFPSRLIPNLCIAAGALLYPWFCKCSTVPDYFPFCLPVFIVNGLVCGLIASAIYKWLIKVVIARFAPPVAAPLPTDNSKPDNNPKV